jgi:hypothetical protein
MWKFLSSYAGSKSLELFTTELRRKFGRLVCYTTHGTETILRGVGRLFVNSASTKKYRIFAFFTLFLCLFWNTIGISVHNHDLFGNELSGESIGCVSSSLAHSIHSRISVAAVGDDDGCPGCSYSAACVSGALVAAPSPQIPHSALTIPSLRIRRNSADVCSAASRGPPVA